MSPPIESQQRIAERLADVRALASLLGDFDPKVLVDLDQEPEIARGVLRALAQICDEVVTDQGIRWRMLPDSRRSTLRELARDKVLGKFARKSKAAPTDVLGRFLIQLSANKPIPIKPLSIPELSQLYTAQQFLELLPARQASRAQVLSALALREFESSLRVALPTDLYGREVELDQLHHYVLREREISDFNQDKPVYLTGLGGAGKSALLAAFARDLLSEKVPVIWFDFDRAAFEQADNDRMTLEFSRQLGFFWPQLSKALARFREQAQEVMGGQYSDDYASNAYSTSSVWSIWRQEMASYLPINKPIALVLDTFEEVLLRGANAHRSVRTWLDNVQQEGQLFGLRPILSGRVPPNDYRRWNIEPMALGDLKPGPAYAMLQRLLQDANIEVEEGLCRRMLAEWGASPLFIRLLAQYLNEEGSVQEATELLENQTFKGVPHTLVRGFTYRRILDRLRTDDADLRDLAYMGLILRRVNAELIRNVLAKPCKLPVLDHRRADDLFETLARQVWLVEETERTGVVRHRGDLRQVMLGIMPQDDLAIAYDVHCQALKYYEEGSDPYLSQDEQDLESDYHRLFIPEMKLGSLRTSPSRLVPSLGEELETVPVEWRAWLKRQMKYKLHEHEFNTLSNEARLEYQSEQVNQTLKSTGTTAVPSHYDDLVSAPDLPSVGSDLPTFIAASFSRADLGVINSLSHDVLDNFFQMIAGSTPSRAYAVDFCETPVWRAALAVVCIGDRETFYHALKEHLVKARFIEWQRPVRTDRSDGLDIATALGMLMGLCGENYLPEVHTGTKRPRQRTHNNDELKALLISSQTQGDFPIGFPAPIATGLLCDLTPDFISALDGELSEFKVHDPNLKSLVNAIQRGEGFKLADFQRKASSVGYVELHRRSMKRPGFRQAFRPLYPELYPYIQGVLRDDNAALLAFTYKASLAPIWPAELRNEQFEKALKRDPERWTATLIHFADRSGLLYDLLHFMAKAAPSNSVREALKLYEAYDKAVMGVESFKANRHGAWLKI